MAQAMKLEDYRRAIGMTVTTFAQEVTRDSGVNITNLLIEEVERYLASGKEHERMAMAAPKAEAIAQFLSKEMGRPITVSMIAGLKVI